MAFTRIRRSAGLLALAGGLALVAAGCTAVGPEASASDSASGTASSPAAVAPAPSTAAGGQTKAAACQILGSSLQDLSSSLQSAYTKYTNDPKSAVAALQKVSSDFQAQVQGVSEPQARALSNKAQADLQTLIADTKDAVAHPLTGVAKVQKLVPTIQADVEKIGSYCA